MADPKITEAHRYAAYVAINDDVPQVATLADTWILSGLGDAFKTHNRVAQALATAEHSALSSLESAMAHIKASGHAGSAMMSVPQILAWAREIGWQG